MKYHELCLGPVAFTTEEIEQARNGNYKPASARLKSVVGDLNRSGNAAKRLPRRTMLKRARSARSSASG
jgi:hypothetical protein